MSRCELTLSSLINLLEALALEGTGPLQSRHAARKGEGPGALDKHLSEAQEAYGQQCAGATGCAATSDGQEILHELHSF